MGQKDQGKHKSFYNYTASYKTFWHIFTLQRPISGVFGVLFLSVALCPMYFITVPKDGILGGISLGPNGRYKHEKS